MKIITVCIFCLNAIFSSYYSQTANTLSSSILVHVNDDIITETDLKQGIKIFLIHNGKNTNTQLSSKEKTEILNDLVIRKIEQQEVKNFCKNILKQHYFISHKDVDNFVKSIVKNQNISHKEYCQLLEKNGIPVKLAYDYWETHMAWSKYLQYMYGQICQPTEREVNDFLKQQNTNKDIILTITRVVIPTNAITEEIAENINYLSYNASNIGEFLNKIKQKFPDISNISPQQMVALSALDPRFANFLNQFKKGEISTPVNTEDGVVIFCIDDKKSVENTTMNTVQARNILFEKKMNAYGLKKLKELKRTSHIKYSKNSKIIS